MAEQELQSLLNAGAALIGSETSEYTARHQQKGRVLQDVLRARLHAFRQLDVVHTDETDSKDLDNSELRTALSALDVLERIHVLLLSSGDASLGTRDTSLLRTLLSIVFKWGTEPLFNNVMAAVPSKIVRSSVPPGTQIIDLTTSAGDYVQLTAIISRLFKLVKDETTEIPSFVVATLLNRHVTDLLKPAIGIAWMPDNIRKNFPKIEVDLRQSVLRFLSRLPPSQTISSLGTILSSTVSLPVYIRKSCGALLTQQLLRPRGVAGLLSAVFGEDGANSADTDAPLERLEHVAKVLTTVPAGKDARDYYSTVIPRVLVLVTPELSDRVPTTHRRAVAFTLSRLLNGDLARSIMLPILHDPFLNPSAPPFTNKYDAGDVQTSHLASDLQNVSSSPLVLTPYSSLQTISMILTNADPSPHLFSTILTPILPSLYALHEHLHPAYGRAKASDPVIRELVAGLMGTWAKSAGKEVMLRVLWGIIETADEWSWEVDAIGEMRRVERTERPKPSLGDLSALMHNSQPKAGHNIPESVEVSNANPLNLQPDPFVFTSLMKTIGDAVILSELFVKLLESYHSERFNEVEEVDPTKTLLKLQLILQMQDQLGDATSSTSILKKPEHVLSFIKHALEESTTSQSDSRANVRKNAEKSGMTKADLRIVPQKEEAGEDVLLENEDSDDEDAPGLEGVQKGDEMTITAINLLLSMLEANRSLSARSSPILNDIYTQLEPLSQSSSDTIGPLAREARLVLTARLASDLKTGNGKSRSASKGPGQEESPEETYQRALKLLQDPILPVRAHGLLLLRELVSPNRQSEPVNAQVCAATSYASTKQSGTAQVSNIPTPRAPSALIPAILSIFLEAIQDDDSYMFLNAVQGLAAMVDGWGADVLKRLLEIYLQGSDGRVFGSGSPGAKGKGKTGKLGRVGKEVSEMERRDVDVRLRVGEALGQVIRRCGGALGKYVDIIVPPLVFTVRSSHLPTTLRTSSVSLLAQCVETNSLAMTAYTTELCSSMLDLIQVETVTVSNVDKNDAETTGENNEASIHPSMDTHPTSTNSKFPPLRRAALHFLARLIRSVTSRVYDSSNNGSSEADMFIQGRLLQRATTLLGYVAVTDRDGVVRVLAKEVVENLEGLKRAILGA